MYAHNYNTRMLTGRGQLPFGVRPAIGGRPPIEVRRTWIEVRPKLSPCLCRKQFARNFNHKVNNFSIALELPARLIIYFE